jgi:hypothetical protein
LSERPLIHRQEKNQAECKKESGMMDALHSGTPLYFNRER